MNVRLTSTAGLIWASASMSVGILSFTLTSILNSLGISNLLLVQLTAASTTLGMLIGAFLSGPLADRFGRRRICIVSAFIFASSNIIVPFIPMTVEAIMILRVASGIGVGGLLPVLAALISELSKPEERGMNICFLESFWAYGWLISLIIAWRLLPVYGWEIAMALVGLISLILTLTAYPFIPPSPRHLLLIGEREKAFEISEKYGLKLPEIKASKPKLTEQINILFSRENRRITVSLWILWLTIAMGYYGIFIWLPKSILSANIPIAKSFQYLLVITFAQIPGYYSAILLVERIGRRIILALYLTLTALASFMYAASTDIYGMMLWGSILSFFDLGSWAALYAYTPEQYPTYARGLGASWASAIGRIGAIIGPYIVPIFNSMGGWYTSFIFFALIHILGSISTLMGREMKGKELPEIVSN